MHLIDRYAYSNRLRRVDPAHKGALAVAAMMCSLLLDRLSVGLTATLWMWGMSSLVAGLPALAVGRLLLAEGLFLALVVVGVAINVGQAPLEGSFWSWSLGPLWLGSSPASVETAVRLAARALGCAAALSFLALTTPVVDLIDLGRRLRVPALLVDLMALVYRFIFALLDSLTRMRVAQECRLGYATVRLSLASAGVLGSRLFLDAFLRSQRLQRSLEGRGYCGELRVLPAIYGRDPRLWWLGAGMVGTLLAARVWL